MNKVFTAQPSTPRQRAGIRFFSIVWLIVVLAGCGSSGAAGRPLGNPTSNNSGTVLDPPVVLTNWTFPSSTGSPLSLTDLRGQVVLLFFGYTNCPDVCPTTIGDFKRVKQQLDAAASGVAFVFISVDGTRDTPAVLRRYLEVFDPSFIGLSADDAQLEAIGKDYGLYYERHPPAQPGAGYIVDHSVTTFLIDRSGQLRMLFSFGTEPARMARGINQLLAEPHS